MYGTGAKRKRRTVLVLMAPDDPRAKYKREYDNKTTKLLHCLLLEINGKKVLQKNKLKNIFKLMGGIEALTESNGQVYYKILLHSNPKEAYKISKKLIKETNIYRTFNVRKAKASTVYLVNYDFPHDLIPPKNLSNFVLEEQNKAKETNVVNND